MRPGTQDSVSPRTLIRSSMKYLDANTSLFTKKKKKKNKKKKKKKITTKTVFYAVSDCPAVNSYP